MNWTKKDDDRLRSAVYQSYIGLSSLQSEEEDALCEAYVARLETRNPNFWNSNKKVDK